MVALFTCGASVCLALIFCIFLVAVLRAPRWSGTHRIDGYDAL